MKYTILVVAACLALSGCATSYQSKGLTGGFSSFKMDEAIYQVNFRGNGYTSQTKAYEYALLRASEICLADGYRYFAVVDQAERGDSLAFNTGGAAQTRGTISQFGNQLQYQGTTQYSPGQTMHFYRPDTGITVVFSRERVKGVFMFDALTLSRSLKEKYNIN